MKIMVLFLMILAHLIADYNLQGWLASAKQKSWWEDNAPDKMYRHDYIAALICHSLMWSILITLPTLLLGFYPYFFIVSLIVNTVLHGIIDTMKANRKIINLCQDQLMHLFQIVVTYIVSLLVV